MKKGMFHIAVIGAALILGLAGCGGEDKAEAELQEVDYQMIFANQTGRDVSRLEIRPSEDGDWEEISLSEAEWKSNYEMPVVLKGMLPETEAGWQVQMTFVDDGTKGVWDGIPFADAETIIFSMAEGKATAEVQAEEQPASSEGETL